MFSVFKKQTGGALVGIILVVAIIAAIYFGSSFFLQESERGELEAPLESLDRAEKEIAKINEKIEEDNQKIKEDFSAEEPVASINESESVAGDTSTTTIALKTNFDLTGWQELIRDNENFQIQYHKDWYYAVNRNEAAQEGYDLIFGFGEDENIWETLPPYAVELVVANKNMEWKYDGYEIELGSKDGKKYILRTESAEKYQTIVDTMASTFQFVN